MELAVRFWFKIDYCFPIMSSDVLTSVGGQNKYCKICVEVNFKTLGGVFLILSQEADLEGACGACAPLKFAKHMLYNVN
jgi:hypothetical protein